MGGERVQLSARWSFRTLLFGKLLASFCACGVGEGEHGSGTGAG